MAAVLSPIVYWGQNLENIFLKVELKDVKDVKVHMDDEKLEFQSSATGTNGKNDYAFTLPFYLEIDSDKSKYRVTDRNVEFQIRKAGKQNWPRLIYSTSKPAWLKIDFDRFLIEDEDESTEDEKPYTKEDYLKQIEQEVNDAKKGAYLDIRLLYMVMYNLFQWVGFAMIIAILLFNLVRHGKSTRTKAFELVGDQLTTVQVCSVLEIVHPIIGWVKTGVFMPCIQVFGRNMILFMIIAQEPLVAEREIVWWLFMTWSSVELIRYPFYILQTIKKEVGIVTWLRYTMWIILYPAGFLCEGIVMMFALPYFEKTGKWTVSLPNNFNITFHFPTFLRIYMVAFFAGMYLLMSRMYEQRKKKLGTVKSSVNRRKKIS